MEQNNPVLEALGPQPPLSEPDARRRWTKRHWAAMNPDKVKKYKERDRNRKRALRKLSPQETKHREALQNASWWKVEENGSEIKLSECPCCGAKFRAFKPTK